MVLGIIVFSGRRPYISMLNHVNNVLTVGCCRKLQYKGITNAADS